MQNKELQLAWDFVNDTNRHIFLTGKAGTGKTTFLRELKEKSSKRMVVVAPTGVAAINARGVTIHSFFQMPFGPILPDEAQVQVQREFKRKFNKKKIDLIRSLDLLVIDEISMVRADLLDAIDQVLRKYKDRSKVFGGVQVLMIGDLQQLSPVVKQHEWNLLKKYYETPYFFSSKSFQNSNPVFIELKHIYRQEDETFIRILNEIRENKLSPESAEKLNSRYIPHFELPDEEEYILLTTHNYKADKINKEKLDAIDKKTYYFEAYVDGHFPENAYPNEKRLALKKGAQVMFIINDSSFEKRYYNGKIGKIVHIDDKNIFVRCPDDEEAIEVKREVWRNITYEIDPDTKAITEKVQGSFSQIPLKLSWAITIHKSQGLTFDKAVIDAELSFAHGQTYVALSRCKTLEGLVLKSPIKPASIINDQRVDRFNDIVENNQPDKEVLQQSKKTFFLETIAELLDFYPFVKPINKILEIYHANRNSIRGNIQDKILEIKEKILPLLQVREKFVRQIQFMAKDLFDPQADKQIQERIIKAVEYYKNQVEELKKIWDEISFEVENKQVNKDLEKNLDELNKQLYIKLYILQNLTLPYNTADYLRNKAQAQLTVPQKKKKTIDYSKIVENSDLLEALRDLRAEFAIAEAVPHFQVFTQETLYELCEHLPVSIQQLKKINGIGKVRLKKYGKDIVELISAYCITNNIETQQDEPEEKKKKINTKEISLNLYNEGKSISEIAKERGLTENTVITHLSHFVASGAVEISDLISLEKFNEIKQIIENNDFESLSELKKIAGERYDWGELRLVMSIVA